MTAWNAWRYPAFYIGPKYALANFTFKPPHTLFIDASLQVFHGPRTHKQELGERGEHISGNKATLRRRLHAAIVRDHLEAREAEGI